MSTYTLTVKIAAAGTTYTRRINRHQLDSSLPY